MKIKPKYITLIFGLFVISIIWILKWPETFHAGQANITRSTEITQGESIAPITVKVALIAPNSDKQQISMDIREISFFAKSLPNGTNKLCVTSLVIMISGNTRSSPVKDFHKFPLDDQDKFCKLARLIPPDENNGYVTTIFTNDSANTRMSEVLNFNDDIYYYPFDGFQLQTASFINLIYFDTDGNVIQEETLMPFLKIETEGELNWDETVSEPKYKNFWLSWLDDPIMIQNGAATDIIENTYLPLITKGPYQPHVVRFSRPLLLRIIFPIIIFSFLAFIYLMTLVDSLELFFSGAIAVLVGLFGAREVLVPVNVAFGTLVDVLIMGLYVVFAISTIVQIVRFFPQLSRHSKPNDVVGNQEPSNNKSTLQAPPRTDDSSKRAKSKRTKSSPR